MFVIRVEYQNDSWVDFALAGDSAADFVKMLRHFDKTRRAEQNERFYNDTTLEQDSDKVGILTCNRQHAYRVLGAVMGWAEKHGYPMVDFASDDLISWDDSPIRLLDDAWLSFNQVVRMTQTFGTYIPNPIILGGPVESDGRFVPDSWWGIAPYVDPFAHHFLTIP